MATDKQTIRFDFAMLDPDSTYKMRACADHARSVGLAWLNLGEQMAALADQLDDLAGPRET